MRDTDSRGRADHRPVTLVIKHVAFRVPTAGEAQLVDRLIRLGNCASPAVGKKCKVCGMPRVVRHSGRGARRCREQGRTDFIPAANDPEGRETWEPGTHIPRPPRPTGAA